MKAVVDFDDVVTCLPIVQEVLQRFDDEHDVYVARDAMLALPIVESPLTDDLVLDVVGLHRRAP